jgi:DNA polymerase
MKHAAEPILHFDLETYSACDLKAHGLSRYKKHPSTGVWLGCYSFDDGPVLTWFGGEPCPPAIVEHVKLGRMVWAHNAAFEEAIWNEILVRSGFPPIGINQFVCTMVMAYAMGIPANLEGAALAMGLEFQKDMAGNRLMIQMSKPRGENEDGSYVWWDDYEKLERLEHYCKTDVKVERELGKRLLPLSKREREIWLVDQAINRRGFPVDLPSVEKGILIAKEENIRMMREMQAMTGNQVNSCTAPAQLQKFLGKMGFEVESVNKESVGKLLDKPDLPSDIRRILELRRDGSKTSTKKLDAIKDRADADSRIRNAFQYHGSHTGRWAGRGVQLQNLPRGKYEAKDTDHIFELMHGPDAVDALSFFYGSPMQVLSNVTRSFFKAAPGKIFLWGDFNAIEARVLGWLAGEEPLLKLFREGQDVYVYAYSRSFGIAVVNVTKDQRQIGKVMVLALGYQGGVGAFQTMAKNYGVHLSDDEVEKIKRAWRQAHPNIVRYWYQLEEQAIAAVRDPGTIHIAGAPGRSVRFKCSGSFLFCELPSKRLLTYPYPKVEWTEYEWEGQKKTKEQLSYMAEDSVTHKFDRHKVYGGLLAENITQAVSRDVLAERLVALEHDKWPVVAHVHDEAITEVLERDVKDLAPLFKRTMEVIPTWATGLPLKVGVDFGKRYRK